MHELQLAILLSLVAYRVTRFVVKDTIIEGTRIWLHTFILGNKKPKLWREKLQELISCPFCISVWISAATVAVADHYVSVPLPVFQWLAVAAGTLVIWRIVEE